MTDAAPSSAVLLVLSTSSTAMLFKCGILVPVPVLTSAMLQTDPTGTLDLTWPAFTASLSGQCLYMQAAISDSTAVCDVALSNALRKHAP